MTDAFTSTVRSLYDSYGAAFSDRDPDAASANWDAPSIRVSPAGVRLDETPADRRAGFVDAIAALDGTGYDHSEPAGIRTSRLSDELALSSVVWTRVTSAGERLARFSPLHVIRRTADGWRFVARASRALNQPIGFESADLDADLDDAPAELRAFFDQYAVAFSRLDPATIAAHWTLPTLVIGPDGGRAVETADGVASLFEPLFDRLRDQGYARSAVAGITAHECDEDVAIADVCWERYDSDDDRLDRFATIHLLHRTADGWQLVAILRHPVASMVALRPH